MNDALIHIVDDDPSTRSALARLCAANGFATMQHEGGLDLAAKLRAPRNQCILLDVRLGSESGLKVQETLREAGVTVPVIFLTGYGTIPMTVRAMRGGAIEFLTKPVEEADLIGAVERALAVDRASQTAKQDQDELAKRLTTLTPREREVMALVIDGLRNKQLATAIGVSEITAKVHKRRIMQKMQARSLPDLVRMAERLNISTSQQG